MSSEYNNLSPGMQRCSYTQVSNTYNTSMAPVNATTVSGTMVVPVWGSIGGYNSLTSANPMVRCTGYNTISTAYGGDCCNASYATKMCSR